MMSNQTNEKLAVLEREGSEESHNMETLFKYENSDDKERMMAWISKSFNDEHFENLPIEIQKEFMASEEADKLSEAPTQKHSITGRLSNVGAYEAIVFKGKELLRLGEESKVKTAYTLGAMVNELKGDRAKYGHKTVEHFAKDLGRKKSTLHNAAKVNRVLSVDEISTVLEKGMSLKAVLDLVRIDDREKRAELIIEYSSRCMSSEQFKEEVKKVLGVATRKPVDESQKTYQSFMRSASKLIGQVDADNNNKDVSILNREQAEVIKNICNELLAKLKSIHRENVCENYASHSDQGMEIITYQELITRIENSLEEDIGKKGKAKVKVIIAEIKKVDNLYDGQPVSNEELAKCRVKVIRESINDELPSLELSDSAVKIIDKLGKEKLENTISRLVLLNSIMIEGIEEGLIYKESESDQGLVGKFLVGKGKNFFFKPYIKSQTVSVFTDEKTKVGNSSSDNGSCDLI